MKKIVCGVIVLAALAASEARAGIICEQPGSYGYTVRIVGLEHWNKRHYGKYRMEIEVRAAQADSFIAYGAGNLFGSALPPFETPLVDGIVLNGRYTGDDLQFRLSKDLSGKLSGVLVFREGTQHGYAYVTFPCRLTTIQ